GDFQGGGAARLGQAAVGEESTPPCGHGVAYAGVDHVRGQATHRATPGIQQPGLPCQGLSAGNHAHHVPVAAPQPSAGDDDDFTAVPVDLVDRLPQPAGGDAGVQFGFHHDAPGDDVQAAGEP